MTGRLGVSCLKMTSVLHPWRITLTIIMEVWKIIFLSKWLIFRFHVNLPGCNRVIFAIPPTPSPSPPLFEVPVRRGGTMASEGRPVNSRPIRSCTSAGWDRPRATYQPVGISPVVFGKSLYFGCFPKIRGIYYTPKWMIYIMEIPIF